MGLVTSILGAPATAPAKGVFWILRKIYDSAYEEFYDPSSIKSQLIALEEQLESGELTEEEFEEIELVLLQRLQEALKQQEVPPGG